MRRRGLSSYEQETIINFNKDEAVAHIFTYEKTWQQHLEKRIGLKPTMDNGFGGKEYELDKRLIKLPRAKRQLSEKAKQRLRALAATRNRRLSVENNTTMVKLARQCDDE